jgi:hypothetical protein
LQRVVLFYHEHDFFEMLHELLVVDSPITVEVS